MISHLDVTSSYQVKVQAEVFHHFFLSYLSKYLLFWFSHVTGPQQQILQSVKVFSKIWATKANMLIFEETVYADNIKRNRFVTKPQFFADSKWKKTYFLQYFFSNHNIREYRRCIFIIMLKLVQDPNL